MRRVWSRLRNADWGAQLQKSGRIQNQLLENSNKKKKKKYEFAFCYKKEKTTHQHGGVLSGLQYGEVGVFGFPHLGLDTNADGLPRFVGVADDAVCRRAFSSTTCMLVPLQQVKNEIAQTGRGW